MSCAVATAGVMVWVDGMYVTASSYPTDRLFVPYKIDPFPRLLLGIPNHQYYLVDEVTYAYQVQNVTHSPQLLNSTNVALIFGRCHVLLVALLAFALTSQLPS